MIGCIAKAKTDTLHMDDTEMEEVRWVSRADVAKALDRSSSKDNPLTGATLCHQLPLACCSLQLLWDAMAQLSLAMREKCGACIGCLACACEMR